MGQLETCKVHFPGVADVLVIRRRDMIAAFFRACQSPLWSWGSFDPLGFASFFIGFFCFWRQRHSMCPVR